MISCNIVSYNNQNLILNTLKQIDGYFDAIRIVFGVPIQELKLEKYLQKNNVQVFFNDWHGSLSNQLNFLLAKAEIGEWFMYLSDDEVPSLPLLESIDSMIKECELNALDGVLVPFADELNYRLCTTVTDVEQLAHEESYLVQNLLFRIRRILRVKKDSFFRGEVHETSFYYMDKNFLKSVWPIMHRKSTIRTILGIAWCALLDHKHNEVPDKIFGDVLWQCLENKIALNVYDIDNRIKIGNISETMKKYLLTLFGQDNLNIGAWAILYYIVYHSDELPQEFDLINNKLFLFYLRWFVIGRERLKITQSELGGEIKKRLLASGMNYIEKDGRLS